MSETRADATDVMVRQLNNATTKGRKLPDDETLIRLHSEGRSVREIADLYGASYEAARLRLKPLVETATQTPPRYGLPWRVRADHAQSAVIQEWKKYRRRELGISRSRVEAQHVDKWLTYMNGANAAGAPLSIAYDDEDGFYLRRRRVGDVDYLSTD